MNTEELKTALATGILVKWRGPLDYTSVVGTLIEIVTYFDHGFKLSAVIRDNGGNLYRCRPEECSFWRPLEAKEVMQG